MSRFIMYVFLSILICKNVITFSGVFFIQLNEKSPMCTRAIVKLPRRKHLSARHTQPGT